jgi:hypothetical protein
LVGLDPVEARVYLRCDDFDSTLAKPGRRRIKGVLQSAEGGEAERALVDPDGGRSGRKLGGIWRQRPRARYDEMEQAVLIEIQTAEPVATSLDRQE